MFQMGKMYLLRTLLEASHEPTSSPWLRSAESHLAHESLSGYPCTGCLKLSNGVHAETESNIYAVGVIWCGAQTNFILLIEMKADWKEALEDHFHGTFSQTACPLAAQPCCKHIPVPVISVNMVCPLSVPRLKWSINPQMLAEPHKNA